MRTRKDFFELKYELQLTYIEKAKIIAAKGTYDIEEFAIELFIRGG